MATFRQAAVDKSTIKLFAERLVELDLDDIQGACKTIEDLPREEGETSFPTLAALLKVIDVEQTARHSREILQLGKALVVWKCPQCKVQTTEFLQPKADLYRHCPRIVGRREDGAYLRCQHVMDVILDERAA